MKCLKCDNEVSNEAKFCPWCGAPISQISSNYCTGNEESNHFNKDSSQTDKHEWPEEEKSVSFTIYEAKPSNVHSCDEVNDMKEDDNLNGSRVTTSSDDSPNQSTSRWKAKHVFFLLLMLLATIGIIYYFSSKSEETDEYLPDYSKVEMKQKLREQKREQKREAERQEALRIQEELRKAAEEEAAAAAAEAARRDSEAMVIDEDVIEERLQEVLDFFE